MKSNFKYTLLLIALLSLIVTILVAAKYFLHLS